MTNKDKSTEKLRALIGTKQIYRIHFKIRVCDIKNVSERRG